MKDKIEEKKAIDLEFAMQINQITKNIISLNDLDSLFEDHRKGSDFTEH